MLAAVLTSGCLPLLLSPARTLRPGEYALAAAGMGRTFSLPAGVRQPGAVAGVVEFRAGLPVADRMDAGLTLASPWHLGSDARLKLVDEGPAHPAAAVQVRLGLLQPSFGGAVALSRGFGRLVVSVQAGVGRVTERLWREGSDPFGSSSENHVKDVVEAAVGLEWRASESRTLLLNLVRWDPSRGQELPEPGAPAFGVREGPSWILSAGYRWSWSRARARPRTDEPVAALRGWIMAAPDGGQFEVGQPGVYRAVVLVDSSTVVSRDGQPASLDDLALGRAVLVQGFPLPRRTTFLARVIELQ